MTAVRRSLLYSFADSYLAIGLQTIGTLVMARLLTPAEAGVFAVASVFAALASTVRDFGVAEYLVQTEGLSSRKISAAMLANLGVSWAMAALLFLGSGALATFFRHPGVGEVMRGAGDQLPVHPVWRGDHGAAQARPALQARVPVERAGQRHLVFPSPSPWPCWAAAT